MQLQLPRRSSCLRSLLNPKPPPAQPKLHTCALSGSSFTCLYVIAVSARTGGMWALPKTSAVLECFSRPTNRCNPALNWKLILSCQRRSRDYREPKSSAAEKLFAPSNAAARPSAPPWPLAFCNITSSTAHCHGHKSITGSVGIGKAACGPPVFFAKGQPLIRKTLIKGSFPHARESILGLPIRNGAFSYVRVDSSLSLKSTHRIGSVPAATIARYFG